MKFPPQALTRLTLLLSLGLGAAGAHALDWTGYFRAGPGLTSNNASRACYALNGGSKGMKYRLGNECDFYGEFQLSQGFQKDGVDYRVTLMTNHWTGATDTDGKGLAIEQMFAEAKGFDIAPNATFWIGKERGRRGDVHIVDTFFTEMAGVGAGVKGLDGGVGKLGVAYVYLPDWYQGTIPFTTTLIVLMDVGFIAAFLYFLLRPTQKKSGFQANRAVSS